MTFNSNVQPPRRVKQAPRRWRHCDVGLAGYVVRCPVCGTRRQDDGVHVRDGRSLNWNGGHDG